MKLKIVNLITYNNDVVNSSVKLLLLKLTIFTSEMNGLRALKTYLQTFVSKVNLIINSIQLKLISTLANKTVPIFSRLFKSAIHEYLRLSIKLWISFNVLTLSL